MNRDSFFPLVLIFICLLITPASAQEIQIAPSQKKIHLSATDVLDFSKAMTSIAGQASTAIVVEGQPLKSQLTNSATAQSVSDMNGTTQTVTAKAAELYGYSVTYYRKIYVLTKTYRDPKDLPVVTTEELRETLADIRRLTAPFLKDITVAARPGKPSPAFADLMLSLTETQLPKISKEAGGLPVTELTPVQRRLFDKCSAFLYLQFPLNAIGDLERNWGYLSQKDSFFTLGTVDDQIFFGYEYSMVGPVTGRRFIQLNNPDGAISTANMTLRANGQPDPGQSQLSNPDPTPDKSKLSNSGVPVQSLSLEEMVKTFNNRSSLALALRFGSR